MILLLFLLHILILLEQMIVLKIQDQLRRTKLFYAMDNLKSIENNFLSSWTLHILDPTVFSVW